MIQLQEPLVYLYSFEALYFGLTKSKGIVVSTIGARVSPTVIVLQGVSPVSEIPGAVVPLPLFSPIIGKPIVYNPLLWPINRLPQ
ncbi:hypothetical protein D3C85_927630 [compost metagenome]